MYPPRPCLLLSLPCPLPVRLLSIALFLDEDEVDVEDEVAEESAVVEDGSGCAEGKEVPAISKCASVGGLKDESKMPI